MKRYQLGLLLLLAPRATLGADPRVTVSAPPDLYALKTPEAPTFVALGVSPTDIQRPTTPSAVAASLVTMFQSQSGSATIPQGFALEASPYWLFPHPTLSFAQYANESIAESWYRNATLSFATSASGTAAADPSTLIDTGASGSNVSFGMRTTLRHPPLSEEQTACATTIANVLTLSADAFSDQANAEATRRANAAWRAEYGELPTAPTAFELAPPKAVEQPAPPELLDGKIKDDAQRASTYERLLMEYRLRLFEYEQYAAARQRYEDAQRAQSAHEEQYRTYKQYVARKRSETINDIKQELKATFDSERAAKRDALIEPCLKTINARGDGLSVDVAAAGVWAFPDARFETSEFRRSLVWGTFGYSSKGLTLLGLARWTHEKLVGNTTSATARDSFDYGARIIYASERWGLSLEFVERSLEGRPRRISGGFDYRMTDGTWATATFGKGYGEGESGALLALAGLQFNLGKQRLAESKEK